LKRLSFIADPQYLSLSWLDVFTIIYIGSFAGNVFKNRQRTAMADGRQVSLLQRVLHIRRVLPRLHTGEVEERRRSMFFRPERNGRIQGQSVWHGRTELLRQADRVVPRLALRHQRGSQNSVGKQQLHALCHRRVEALWSGSARSSENHDSTYSRVGQNILRLSTPFESSHRDLESAQTDTTGRERARKADRVGTPRGICAHDLGLSGDILWCKVGKLGRLRDVSEACGERHWYPPES
jgi:hypothetical protein